MLLRARTVVTMESPPIDDGGVLISADRIAAVGRFHDLKSDYSDSVVDLGEQILLPGLINAHCHLDYTALRGRIPPQSSFTDWIRAINAAKEKLSPDDYLNSIRLGVNECRKFGTTSIVNTEAFPELGCQITAPLRLWWLGELIDVRSPESSEEIINSAIQKLKPLIDWGLAPHAPFTVSPLLYQRCAETAVRHGLPLSTHLAESREEMQMFRDGSGPLHAFLKSLGRDMDDCGQRTPLGHFVAVLSTGVPEAFHQLDRWIVVHLNELSNSDFELLRQLKSKFHVVHCPRSHRYFGHSAFQFERLTELGFNVCLGTDSLASNENLSLFAELQALAKTHPNIAARDLLGMVTVNPARALGQQRFLGSLAPGAFADLIAIADDAKDDVFDRIAHHNSGVDWMMVRGALLAV